MRCKVCRGLSGGMAVPLGAPTCVAYECRNCGNCWEGPLEASPAEVAPSPRVGLGDWALLAMFAAALALLVGLACFA